MTEYTYLSPDREPPVARWVGQGCRTVSCLKDGEFLIRSWSCYTRSMERLIEPILHYVGRLNLDDYEWWGMTYGGLPYYVGRVPKPYGLTIQYYTPPEDDFTLRMVNEGRLGKAYGKPVDLS